MIGPLPGPTGCPPGPPPGWRLCPELRAGGEDGSGALFQPWSPSSGLRGSLGGGCSLKVTHHLGLAALWMGIVIPDSLRPPPQGASAVHLEHGLRSWPGWPRAGSGGEGGLPDRGVEGTPMPPSLHPPASPEVWGGISISKPSLWLFKSTSFRLGGLTLLLSFLARNQFLL